MQPWKIISVIMLACTFTPHIHAVTCNAGYAPAPVDADVDCVSGFVYSSPTQGQPYFSCPVTQCDISNNTGVLSTSVNYNTAPYDGITKMSAWTYCKWILKSIDSTDNIELTFTAFALENNFDWLDIYTCQDATDENTCTKQVRYSGKSSAGDLAAPILNQPSSWSSHILKLEVSGDSYTGPTDYGFSLTWATTAEECVESTAPPPTTTPLQLPFQNVLMAWFWPMHK